MKHLFVFIFFVFFIFACGPVNSTLQIRKAELEIKKAYKYKANQKAPYEFYKAKAYLNKAKDEKAFSDFKEAEMFASISFELAKKAKEISKKDDVEVLNKEVESRSIRKANDVDDKNDNLD